MTATLTLYLGNTDADRSARQQLQRWCAERGDVALTIESIHANPAAALRLRITQLPALVCDDTVLAQGPPDDWLTRSFLDRLAARFCTDRGTPVPRRTNRNDTP